MRKFIWNTSRIPSVPNHTYCWTKIYTFLNLSVTPRRFLFMDILDSEFCVQNIWKNSTVLTKMSVVGCRCIIRSVQAYHLNLSTWQITSSCVWICQRHYHRLLYQVRNAPRGVEIVHCKCGIEMYPMTGVIICCKRFRPHGKSAYIFFFIIIIFFFFILKLVMCASSHPMLWPMSVQ